MVLLMVPQDMSLSQRIVAMGKSDRFLAAARWCAAVVAVLQLLLAGLHAWIILDLQLFGGKGRSISLLSHFKPNGNPAELSRKVDAAAGIHGQLHFSNSCRDSFPTVWNPRPK